VRTNLWRSSWTSGPDQDRDGPVLVSVTDFKLNRITDLPGVYRSAQRLAAGWPELEGAYGMWLWARTGDRRCGAVAVWREESALARFVAWHPHVTIMRAYRDRGTLVSTTWPAEVFDPTEIWARARAELLSHTS
jgi:hypothetical protein